MKTHVSRIRILLFLGGLFVFGPACRDRTNSAPVLAAPDEASSVSKDSQSLGNALLAAGYEPEAATRVAAAHQDLFASLGDSVTERERLVDRLAVLGNRPTTQNFLKEHPEMAGLLSSVTDSDALVHILMETSGDDAAALINVILLSNDRLGRDAAIRVFARHGSWIARLQRMGLIGVETLFPASLQSEADRIFDRWLIDEIRAVIRDGDRLAVLLLFVCDQGATIQRRLARDPSFRTRFASELWPNLIHVSGKPGQPLELFLDEPHVWDVLLRPEGERLLATYGPAAIEFLYGPDAYPPALRDQVAHLLLVKQAESIRVNQPFCHDPYFHDLIAARLPDDLFAAVVSQLRSGKSNSRDTLERFWKLREDPSRLKEAFDNTSPLPEWIPFYAGYAVGRKILDGESVSTLEWIDAISDLSDLQTGAKLLKYFVKAGVRLEVRQTIRNSAASQAAKQVGRGLTCKAAEKVLASSPRELVRWSKSALYAEARAHAGKSTFEITSLTRLFYRQTGVGRAWFRRITGFEARVFMRKDARIVLCIDESVLNFARQQLRDHVTKLTRQTLEDQVTDQFDSPLLAASTVLLLDALFPTKR